MGIIDSKTVKRNKNILNQNTFFTTKMAIRYPGFYATLYYTYIILPHLSCKSRKYFYFCKNFHNFLFYL